LGTIPREVVCARHYDHALEVVNIVSTLLAHGNHVAQVGPGDALNTHVQHFLHTLDNGISYYRHPVGGKTFGQGQLFVSIAMAKFLY
jgi:hypothetical protein